MQEKKKRKRINPETNVEEGKANRIFVSFSVFGNAFYDRILLQKSCIFNLKIR